MLVKCPMKLITNLALKLENVACLLAKTETATYGLQGLWFKQISKLGEFEKTKH